MLATAYLAVTRAQEANKGDPQRFRRRLHTERWERWERVGT